MCPPCNIAFVKKWRPPIFSGDTIKIGVFEDFEKKEKTFFGAKKKVELLPARSQGLKKLLL